jgi:Ca2+-binding RTX toxin-like protein
MARTRSRISHWVVAFAVGVTVTLVLASPASATFPGLNGGIAFIRFGPGAEIVAVDPSAGVVFQSPYFGPSDYDPAWSPDGRWLAFSRIADITAQDGIYVVDAWGGHLRRLTRGDDEDPSWAPSGDKIVYDSHKPGIWVTNADGTDAHQIVADLDAEHPSWSPDGETIAFDDGGGGIFLVRPDGSGLQKILSTGLAPKWAPDSSQLTYLGGDVDLDESEVWVAQRDGSGAHPVTRGSTDLWPTWSPDGKWIAFSRTGRFSCCDFKVYVIRPNGIGLRRLTSGPDDVDVDWQPIRCTQIGTSGPDRLVGTPAPDVLCSKGGDDTLRAVGGNDILVSSGGDDLLVADGRTVLFGGWGNDRLLGGRNNDVLAGGFGSDLLRGGGGNDLPSGGAGPDGLYGGPDSDRLFGGSGRDSLFGGRGDDRLFSRDRQRDWLDGGPGSDCAVVDPPRIDKVEDARRCTLRQLQRLAR